MHAGLSEFIAVLDRATTGVAVEAGHPEQSLFFILDQQAVQDIQAQIFAADETVEPIQLYQGPDFEHLAESGPLWFSAPPGGALQHLGETLCQEQAAGIAVIAADGQAALAHARGLLQVNDGSGGQSLITYYRPDVWPALALTASEGLFGPWHGVHSPAPRHIGAKPGQWLEWHADGAASSSSISARYSLTPSTQPTCRTLRWLYWVDGYYQAFNSPAPAQLPALLDNLELLVEHGINEGRWLVKLADLSSRGPLSEREAVMAVLRGKTEPFIKVEQLQALAP